MQDCRQAVSKLAAAHDVKPSPADGARPWNPLVWILLFGALLRFVLWIAWGNWSPLINDDARDYQGLAIRLATTGQYTNANGIPVSLRPPLYPAIVAATYWIFGLENDDAVRAIQAVIGLLTVLIVYRIAVIAYSHRVAVLAAAIVAFYPSWLGYANLLLSETLFTFLVAAFTWLVCEALRRQQTTVLIAAGFVMGLAALTRSIMLLFAPILGMLILFSWHGGWRRRLLASALPLAAFFAVIAPWAIRNTRVQQTLTIIDVMGGRNAMMGNYEYTPLERSWATISDVPDEYQWHRVLRRESPNGTPLTQGQLDKLALRHAIQFVWSHPWLTLKRDVVKFFNFWQLEREFLAASLSGYFGNLSAPTTLTIGAVICGSYAAVLFAALFGLCCKPVKDFRIHMLLVLSIVFPCAIHTLIFAHSRYHLPIVPFLAVYASAAMVHREEIWRRRRSLGFGIAVALCLLAAMGWLRELVLVDFNFIQRMFG
jgi:4-amino-4-deoxy-L-arabinose transferase-like glycosyltransferase